MNFFKPRTSPDDLNKRMYGTASRGVSLIINENKSVTRREIVVSSLNVRIIIRLFSY